MLFKSSSFFFVALFFTLHTNGKRCSQEGSHPCYSKSQVVYVYHVFSLSLQGFVLPKYHCWPTFFWPDIKTEMNVVIYMYLNIPQIILGPWN